MTPESLDWLEGLKAFAEKHRAARPPRAVPMDSADFAARQILLGAHLRRWLATDFPRLRLELERRASGPPAIVLAACAPGVAAAEEVLAGCDDPLTRSIACVREVEYRLWCIRHPDAAYSLHVNPWSWIKAPVPLARWGEFRHFPLVPGECYWLHRYGLAGEPALESRQCDLWKWDGRQAAQLAVGIVERVRTVGR